MTRSGFIKYAADMFIQIYKPSKDTKVTLDIADLRCKMEHLLVDLFLQLQDEAMQMRKFYGKLERGVKKVTFYEALTVFKGDAYYWAIGNRGHDQAERILRTLKSNQVESIEKAKSVPIEDVLRSHNIKVIRNRCACPICKSGNNTTMRVSDGFFFCFKCASKGDVIELARLVNNFDFKQALHYLKHF